MLHIMTPENKHTFPFTLKDIFAHRLDFQQSENIEPNHFQQWCSFNTQNTTYLAYQSPSYGLVGSAKLIYRKDLPLSLSSFIENKEAFILSDCLFHLPEQSKIFKAPDFVVRKNFSDLLEAFYGSLIAFLESKALADKTPFVYFYLSEEDFDFISQYSERDVCVKKEIQTAPDLENCYFGFLDFSDLIYDGKAPYPMKESLLV